MGVTSGAVGRWTRAFVLVSTLAFVLLAGLVTAGVGRHEIAVVGVFGFVLPMVFGMAYVLLPPYVGRTFEHTWLPAIHFVAAIGGFLAVGWAVLVGGPWWILQAGVGAWSIGVLCFVGGLAWTAIPAIQRDPAGVFRLGDRPQRSTRLATAMLPVGIAYLVAAMTWLVWSGADETAMRIAFPRVVHLALAGFAVLLVFALGARLLRGFFHVDPPRWLVWMLLLPGAMGPVLLAARPFGTRVFLVGAVLESVAMVAYLALVGVVVASAKRIRVGLYGIGLGALAGTSGAVVALGAVVGGVPIRLLDLHAVLLLQGFFGLTIVGYAFQFFPVTAGRFPGATRRGALAVIGLLACGIAVHALGAVTAIEPVRVAGGLLGLLGALGYGWLLGRRLLGEIGT